MTLVATCFMLLFCLSCLSSLKNEVACSFVTHVVFNGLHVVMSQKVQVFISASVRSSNRRFDVYSSDGCEREICGRFVIIRAQYSRNVPGSNLGLHAYAHAHARIHTQTHTYIHSFWDFSLVLLSQGNLKHILSNAAATVTFLILSKSLLISNYYYYYLIFIASVV
jgi:hypothetical protein